MATVPTAAELHYEQAHFDETQVPALLTSNIICLSIAYSAVSLRFLCRRIGHVKHDWDDWLVASGLVRISIHGPRMIGIFSSVFTPALTFAIQRDY